MDEARIIIIGSNGQLGKALQAKYPKATAVDRDDFDITDWEFVKSFDWSKVDVILNAAAYTNVDGSETPDGRRSAWLINATGPGFLARVAAEHGIILVHVSSEYVFDGMKEIHTEEEIFAPLGVYGQSKAAGDIAVSTAPKHYIVRTSWLIGDGPNFVRTMMGLAEKDISPIVVSDQIGRLTFTSTLVNGIHHILSTGCAYGTYNISDDGGPASWADVARAIFKDLGRDDLSVKDTTTAEYFASREGIAPRPLNSTFNLDKIKSVGFQLKDWHEELEEYLTKEQNK